MSCPLTHRATSRRRSVSNGDVMRIVGPLAVAVAACALGLAACSSRDEPLPRIGPASNQSVRRRCGGHQNLSCACTAPRPPESWPHAHFREVPQLPFHSGEFVSVEGVLHAEFESVRSLLRPGLLWRNGGTAPRGLRLIRCGRPRLEWWWRTRGPLRLAARCARVEGWYEGGAAGHFGAFDGTVDVLRLEVWSTPHRPFETTPPAPPAPPPPPRSSR